MKTKIRPTTSTHEQVTHVKRISKMSTEWQTVMGKGKKAPPSTTTSAYVPPHLRAMLAAKAAEEKANRPLDVKDEEQFPTFIGRNIRKQEQEQQPQGVSFKQTIDNLIALEKRTEWEKEQAEEAKRALEGFVRLPLRVNRDWVRSFNKKVYHDQVREKEIEILQETGCWVLPPAEHIYGAYPEEEEEPMSDEDV